jgi:sugar lactone lactonase YvrE
MIRHALKIFILGFVAFSGVTVNGQKTYGTVDLPAYLADSGSTVQPYFISAQNITTWCETPAYDFRTGNLYIAEQNAGVVWKVTPAKVGTPWLAGLTQANCMAMAADGYLIVGTSTSLAERNTDSTIHKTLTTASGGNTPWGQGSNDITFASNGDLYFTTFNYSFWFHSLDSSINTDYLLPNADGNVETNGIYYEEEKGLLWVNMWGINQSWVYPVTSRGVVDTTTAHRKKFANITGPDGMTVDSLYNVYIASNDGTTGNSGSVMVYDSNGDSIGRIIMKQHANGTGAVTCPKFGGPDNKTLFITGDSGVFYVHLKVPGRLLPHTPPYPFMLATPSNGATGVATAPTLSWSSTVGNATSYGIEISTSSTFASATYLDTGITSPSTVLSGLAPGTTYYWQANASNAYGAGLWSSVWSFNTTTVGVVPETPLPVKPEFSVRGGLIKYSLSAAGPMSLSLTDIRGRNVFMMHRTQPAGQYSVDVKDFALPSGCYVAWLKAGRYARHAVVVVEK